MGIDFVQDGLQQLRQQGEEIRNHQQLVTNRRREFLVLCEQQARHKGILAKLAGQEHAVTLRWLEHLTPEALDFVTQQMSLDTIESRLAESLQAAEQNVARSSRHLVAGGSGRALSAPHRRSSAAERTGRSAAMSGQQGDFSSTAKPLEGTMTPQRSRGRPGRKRRKAANARRQAAMAALEGKRVGSRGENTDQLAGSGDHEEGEDLLSSDALSSGAESTSSTPRSGAGGRRRRRRNKNRKKMYWVPKQVGSQQEQYQHQPVTAEGEAAEGSDFLLKVEGGDDSDADLLSSDDGEDADYSTSGSSSAEEDFEEDDILDRDTRRSIDRILGRREDLGYHLRGERGGRSGAESNVMIPEHERTAHVGSSSTGLQLFYSDHDAGVASGAGEENYHHGGPVSTGGGVAPAVSSTIAAPAPGSFYNSTGAPPLHLFGEAEIPLALLADLALLKAADERLAKSVVEDILPFVLQADTETGIAARMLLEHYLLLTKCYLEKQDHAEVALLHKQSYQREQVAKDEIMQRFSLQQLNYQEEFQKELVDALERLYTEKQESDTELAILLKLLKQKEQELHSFLVETVELVLEKQENVHEHELHIHKERAEYLQEQVHKHHHYLRSEEFKKQAESLHERLVQEHEKKIPNAKDLAEEVVSRNKHEAVKISPSDLEKLLARFDRVEQQLERIKSAKELKKNKKEANRVENTDEVDYREEQKYDSDGGGAPPPGSSSTKAAKTVRIEAGTKGEGGDKIKKKKKKKDYDYDSNSSYNYDENYSKKKKKKEKSDSYDYEERDVVVAASSRPKEDDEDDLKSGLLPAIEITNRSKVDELEEDEAASQMSGASSVESSGELSSSNSQESGSGTRSRRRRRGGRGRGGANHNYDNYGGQNKNYYSRDYVIDYMPQKLPTPREMYEKGHKIVKTAIDYGKKVYYGSGNAGTATTERAADDAESTLSDDRGSGDGTKRISAFSKQTTPAESKTMLTSKQEEEEDGAHQHHHKASPGSSASPSQDTSLLLQLKARPSGKEQEALEEQIGDLLRSASQQERREQVVEPVTPPNVPQSTPETAQLRVAAGSSSASSPAPGRPRREGGPLRDVAQQDGEGEENETASAASSEANPVLSPQEREVLRRYDMEDMLQILNQDVGPLTKLKKLGVASATSSSPDGEEQEDDETLMQGVDKLLRDHGPLSRGSAAEATAYSSGRDEQEVEPVASSQEEQQVDEDEDNDVAEDNAAIVEDETSTKSNRVFAKSNYTLPPGAATGDPGDPVVGGNVENSPLVTKTSRPSARAVGAQRETGVRFATAVEEELQRGGQERRARVGNAAENNESYPLSSPAPLGGEPPFGATTSPRALGEGSAVQTIQGDDAARDLPPQQGGAAGSITTFRAGSGGAPPRGLGRTMTVKEYQSRWNAMQQNLRESNRLQLPGKKAAGSANFARTRAAPSGLNTTKTTGI